MGGGITDMTSVYFSLFSYPSAHRELQSDPPPPQGFPALPYLVGEPSQFWGKVQRSFVFHMPMPHSPNQPLSLLKVIWIPFALFFLSLLTASKLYRKESGIIGCLLPSLQHLVSTFSLEESEHKPLWSEKQRAPLHPTLLIQTEGGRMASQPGCSMGVSEWLWGETQKQTKLCQLPRIYVDV